MLPDRRRKVDEHHDALSYRVGLLRQPAGVVVVEQTRVGPQTSLTEGICSLVTLASGHGLVETSVDTVVAVLRLRGVFYSAESRALISRCRWGRR